MCHLSPLLCYLGEPTRVPKRLGDTQHLKSPSSLEHLSFDIKVYFGGEGVWWSLGSSAVPDCRKVDRGVHMTGSHGPTVSCSAQAREGWLV